MILPYVQSNFLVNIYCIYILPLSAQANYIAC